MPTLEEMIRAPGVAGSGSTGVNPQLEQMLGRISQLQGPSGPGGGMPPVSGGPAMGMPGGMQGGPMAAPGGGMGAMGAAPPESPAASPGANVTYQMLIKAGVPPEIAKQAIAEPKFLQEILLELQKQQLGTQQNQNQAAAGAGAPVNPAARG